MNMIKQVMKSPFSGGNAVLRCEPSTLTFRKEEFCYIHQFYECEDTHERFTTTELNVRIPMSDSQQRNWMKRTLLRYITSIAQNMASRSQKRSSAYASTMDFRPLKCRQSLALARTSIDCMRMGTCQVKQTARC